MRSKYNWSNSHAIITGGGSGIGRSTAILLSQRLGIKVTICGRRVEPLNETIDIIRSSGGKSIAIRADIRRSEEIIHLINSAQQEFGPVNILVNNAGVAIAKPLINTSESEWNAMIDSNLKGTYLTCKLLIPEMLKSPPGIIVNVSSILGKTGIANFAAYSASKFGIIGLTQAIAKEHSPSKIRIYALCPGRTATNMQIDLGGELISSMSMAPEKVANKILQIITGRTGSKSGQEIIFDKQSVRLELYELLQRVKSRGYRLRKAASDLRKRIP